MMSGLGSDVCGIDYHMGLRGTEVLKSQKNTILIFGIKIWALFLNKYSFNAFFYNP